MPGVSWNNENTSTIPDVISVNKILTRGSTWRSLCVVQLLHHWTFFGSLNATLPRRCYPVFEPRVQLTFEEWAPGHLRRLGFERRSLELPVFQTREKYCLFLYFLFLFCVCVRSPMAWMYSVSRPKLEYSATLTITLQVRRIWMYCREVYNYFG